MQGTVGEPAVLKVHRIGIHIVGVIEDEEVLLGQFFFAGEVHKFHLEPWSSVYLSKAVKEAIEHRGPHIHIILIEIRILPPALRGEELIHPLCQFLLIGIRGEDVSKGDG